MIDEAIVNGDMSVYDVAAFGFVKVDFEITHPDHAVCVFKRVVDMKVQAGVYKDKVVEFMEILEVFHPVDIGLWNLSWAFHAKTLKGGCSTHFLPVALDLRFEEMPVLISFPGLNTIILMVAFEAVERLAFGLEIHEIIDDFLTSWTSINIITQEEQFVFSGDF